jgi:hypothetical protein
MNDAVNPFEVLRLDPTASEEEIVGQAGRLRQRAADEADLTALRQAVQALTGAADDRLLHALLTHPRPGHAAPALDRLVAAFRRVPAATGTPVPCPPPDLAEVAALLQPAVAEELDTPALPFDPVPATEPPDEVHRQSDEALWQALPGDPRS